MAIRVMIADSYEVVRIGLRTALQVFDIVVVAECETTENFISVYRASRPDLLVTETQFVNQSALTQIGELKAVFPEAKIVIYTGANNPSFVAKAVVIGVDDYVEKNTPMNVLADAVVRVYHGILPLPKEHCLNRASLLLKMNRQLRERDIPLTDREIQVLRHLAFGMTNKEIAHSLNLSVETIKEHVQNILHKMRFDDRTQAAVWAVRMKIV